MDLWHIRLGHAHEGGDEKVSTGLRGVNIPKSQKLSFCDTCQIPKSKIKLHLFFRSETQKI
jgi:hypothetical protein